MRTGLAARTDIEVDALRRHARLEADGRVVVRLSAKKLAMTSDLAAGWDEQRRALGFR